MQPMHMFMAGTLLVALSIVLAQWNMGAQLKHQSADITSILEILENNNGR